MRRQIKEIVTVFLLGFTIISTHVHADTGRGGYAGSFLRMGLGARSMAMGGGSVALADDGYTTYYNPAGLVFLEDRWVTASLNSMALDRNLHYLGYAQSIGGSNTPSKNKGPLNGGFSVGWLHAGVDQIDARGYSGEDIGTLSFSENCFYFSFALKPSSKFAFGFSGKVMYSRFPEITDDETAMSTTGFGFDFGALFRPVSSLQLGLTVRDIRIKYTWDSQDIYEKGTQTIDRFPQVLRLGAAWRGIRNRLLLSFDVEKVEYWPASIRTGIEFQVYDGIFLRSGLMDSDVSFGAGYRLHAYGKATLIDYAYVPDPVAPRGNHVFSWSFIF